MTRTSLWKGRFHWLHNPPNDGPASDSVSPGGRIRTDNLVVPGHAGCQITPRPNLKKSMKKARCHVTPGCANQSNDRPSVRCAKAAPWIFPEADPVRGISNSASIVAEEDSSSDLYCQTILTRTGHEQPAVESKTHRRTAGSRVPEENVNR